MSASAPRTAIPIPLERGRQHCKIPAPSSVAIHEAGHAVIARVLGLSCGSVTVEPDTTSKLVRRPDGKLELVPDQPRLGHTEIAREWYPKRTATEQECDQAFATALYAGSAAELVICGKQEHTNQDRQHAASVLGAGATHLEPQLRARAHELVLAHRTTIEWVARALDQRRTLYPMQVAAVMEIAKVIAEGELEAV